MIPKMNISMIFFILQIYSICSLEGFSIFLFIKMKFQLFYSYIDLKRLNTEEFWECWYLICVSNKVHIQVHKSKSEVRRKDIHKSDAK